MFDDVAAEDEVKGARFGPVAEKIHLAELCDSDAVPGRGCPGDADKRFFADLKTIIAIYQKVKITVFCYAFFSYFCNPFLNFSDK